jgi:hypothetical protein
MSVNDAPPECGLPIGTMVLTPTGQVPVETLEAGSMVMAVSGGTAPFQAVSAVRRFRWDGPLVRVRAEALDDGTPQGDLLLLPTQGVMLEGVLVAAGALVNGLGVVMEPGGTPVQFVAIILGGHDALLAAGAAVESVRPHPDAPDCAPRRAPDASLRAMLSWRAEHMGWVARRVAPARPNPGMLRERLEAQPFTAVVPVVPPFGKPE